MGEGDTATVAVEFCGEYYPVGIGESIIVGREGDIAIDDNRFLHRRFLAITYTEDRLCLLSNIGSRLHATACDSGGRMEAYIAPGVTVPLVFPVTQVFFAAGSTSYELTVQNNSEVAFSPAVVSSQASGEATLGLADMTPSQLLLLVALAEHRLLSDAPQVQILPTSAKVARRLGWPITTFNRKLDNVCMKLARLGVQGLLGQPGQPANSRRARLVEYSLGTGLVTKEHLSLLDTIEQELGIQ